MATSPTSEVRQAVSLLIEVCRDAQQGFELAARGVVDEPILRAELLQYSGQRQEFVADLNDALRRAGEDPIAQVSPTSPSVRPPDLEDDDFARLQQAVTANDRLGILVECERAEAASAEAYRRVVNAGLPLALGNTVAVQLQAINRVHARIQSLMELAASDAPDH